MHCLAVLVCGLLVALAPATGVQAGSIPASLRIEPSVEPHQVSAPSWILYDETFDRELAALEPRERRAMASTTKMMTALVVVERASLDEPVTISEEAAGVGEAEIDLVAGEQVTVRDLLAAILIGSANDAAMALAEHVAGSVADFVELMNQKAVEMGLEDSHFVNPHGLDDPAHYSSAHDLLEMGRALMAHPLLAEMVRTRRYPFPEAPSGRTRAAQATNQLLRTYPGAVGVKTGYTGRAGFTLVAAAERDGRRIYAVVMGSEDHFVDAVSLLEYGFEAFGPTEVFRAGTPYAQHRAADGVEAVRSSAGATVFMAVDEAERLSLRLATHETKPILVATVDEREVARVELERPPDPALPELREAAAWASLYWDRLWGSRR